MENQLHTKTTTKTTTLVSGNELEGKSGSINGSRDNEVGLAEANAFRRTSKTLRSPVLAAVTRENETEATKSNIVDSVDSKRSAFCGLGEKIRSLVEMLEDGKRRSIHQPMRDAIESIKALYELAAIEQGDQKAKDVIRKSSGSQTSPWLRHNPDPKRKLDGAVLTPNPKRTNLEKTKRTNLEKTTTNVQQVTGTPSTSTTGRETPKVDATQWRTVAKKTKPRDARPRRVRPDAIVIEAKGETSYAEILKSVKSDPKLGELGKMVTKIRRTQKGEILIQLANAGEQTKEFTSIIGDTLGERGAVRSLTQKKVLECKDIDEITTKEDVISAICDQFDIGASTIEVVNIRKTFNGTQTAVLSLTESEANKILAAGRVKVGWVNCRIRERLTLTRCFKCLEFGHIRRDCKNKADRSKQCRKCGEEGHIAKECSKEPECMLCKARGESNSQHIAGSGRCPVFKRALSDQRR